MRPHPIRAIDLLAKPLMQAPTATENRHEELQSAWLYRIIAGVEADPKIAHMFSALADSATQQAEIWSAQIGGPAPPFEPEFRARIVAWLVRRIGARAIKPMLAAMKVRGLSALQSSVGTLDHAMPTQVSEVGARHRGVARGGNLRAAVFGVNDGLVSNACLILGIAGAGSESGTILTTGVAGMLAGALSMAAGEYVSVRSQREVFESQLALERAELQSYPEEEMEELALIYSARGLELEAARRFARELIQNPEHALDTLAREELGLNPDDLGSPWGAAISSFTAFALGACVPLLALLGRGTTSPLIAVGSVALLALFAIGAALSLFTGRSAWWSGARMVLIGAAAGGATFLIGHWLGVAASVG